MLKLLISLVFLLIPLHWTSACSDTNSVILPKIKPKKLEIATDKERISVIYPEKKPSIKKKVSITKKNILIITGGL